VSRPLERRDWRAIIVFPAWVFLAFVVSQLLIGGLVWLVVNSGFDIARLGSQAVIQTAISAAVYALTLFITFGAPYIIDRKVSLETLGLKRLMSWTDIGLAPLGYIVYIITLVVVMTIVVQFVPAFKADEVQNVGFESLTNQMGYILAFTTLVVIAPVAEEILFRGYLYGKLRRHVPIWASIIATSMLFALVHGQWNVAIDTFVLSLFLCGLRELTGSVWAGILVHMIKNGIAFYVLFLAPLVTPGLGS
jgi:membrane protease YdiL (CAAX protease family)